MAHSPAPWRTEPTCVEVFDAKGDHVVWEMGNTNEDDRRLIAAAPELLAALRLFVDRYTQLVNSGDCGNWNPETDEEVITARAAIAKAEGR